MAGEILFFLSPGGRNNISSDFWQTKRNHAVSDFWRKNNAFSEFSNSGGRNVALSESWRVKCFLSPGRRSNIFSVSWQRGGETIYFQKSGGRNDAFFESWLGEEKKANFESWRAKYCFSKSWRTKNAFNESCRAKCYFFLVLAGEITYFLSPVWRNSNVFWLFSLIGWHMTKVFTLGGYKTISRTMRRENTKLKLLLSFSFGRNKLWQPL